MIVILIVVSYHHLHFTVFSLFLQVGSPKHETQAFFLVFLP